MPRTPMQAAGFVLGFWLALELVQPIGLSGPRGTLATAASAQATELPAVSSPPPGANSN